MDPQLAVMVLLAKTRRIKQVFEGRVITRPFLLNTGNSFLVKMSSLDDLLFDEGIVPYPTAFPDESDVMSAIDDDLFSVAELDIPNAASTDDVEAAINSDTFDAAEVLGSNNDEIADLEREVAVDAGVDVPIRKKSASADKSDEGWNSVSYAYGLANLQFRPKLKFMFYVDFAFKPEFAELSTSEWGKNMAFMAKAVDRPKATIEYEDINQYNFKTKVVKNVKNEEVSITFYDDSSNYVVDFFRFILSLLHPVTRRSNSYNSELSTGAMFMTESHGMVFSGDPSNPLDFSHRGTIETDNGQIFQTIKVTQTFMVPYGDVSARQMSYLYVNPMISSIEMNELSSEDTSNTGEITIKFSYDAVIIPNGEDLQNPRNPMPDAGSIKSDFETGQPSGPPKPTKGDKSVSSSPTASLFQTFNFSDPEKIINENPTAAGAFLSASAPGIPTNLSALFGKSDSAVQGGVTQRANSNLNNSITILARDVPAVGQPIKKLKKNSAKLDAKVEKVVTKINTTGETAGALNDVLTAGSDFFGMFK